MILLFLTSSEGGSCSSLGIPLPETIAVWTYFTLEWFSPHVNIVQMEQEWVWGGLAAFLSSMSVIVTTLWALPLAHPFPLAVASVIWMDHIEFGHLSHSQCQLWVKGLRTLGFKPFWWRLPLCCCLVSFIFYYFINMSTAVESKGECVFNFIRKS